MRPNPEYLAMPKAFWAYVRTVSEKTGYTDRRTKGIKVPTRLDVSNALVDLHLSEVPALDEPDESLTVEKLISYFEYRASVLNDSVQFLLMDFDEARARFDELLEEVGGSPKLIMNKQKGSKAGPALLTNAVNLLAASVLGEEGFDPDPRRLATFQQDGRLIRTMSRRVDGAYPSIVDPVAIWEIKEYYHTTTFGSRVADGVYESLLDGMELEELLESEGVDCRHYLFVDSHFTWWIKGRSYLCRLVDMLHMGYVDEVLFGKEVYLRVPELAREWVDTSESRHQ